MLSLFLTPEQGYIGFEHEIDLTNELTSQWRKYIFVLHLPILQCSGVTFRCCLYNNANTALFVLQSRQLAFNIGFVIRWLLVIQNIFTPMLCSSDMAQD